jgi:hypothetical protein
MRLQLLLAALFGLAATTGSGKPRSSPKQSTTSRAKLPWKAGLFTMTPPAASDQA